MIFLFCLLIWSNKQIINIRRKYISLQSSIIAWPNTWWEILHRGMICFRLWFQWIWNMMVGHMHNGLGSRSQRAVMSFMDERKQALRTKNARQEAGQEETWNKIQPPKIYSQWPTSLSYVLPNVPKTSKIASPVETKPLRNSCLRWHFISKL